MNKRQRVKKIDALTERLEKIRAELKELIEREEERQNELSEREKRTDEEIERRHANSYLNLVFEKMEHLTEALDDARN